MNIVFLALLSFLSVVGVVELIRKLVFWAYKPGEDQIYMGAILKTADETENTVRSLMKRIRWMELGTPVRLILVDKSGDPEVAEIAGKIIQKFPGIALLSEGKINYNK